MKAADEFVFNPVRQFREIKGNLRPFRPFTRCTGRYAPRSKARKAL